MRDFDEIDAEITALEEDLYQVEKEMEILLNRDERDTEAFWELRNEKLGLLREIEVLEKEFHQAEESILGF